MSDWLLADDIERMIDDMVVDKACPAFEHNGLVHLYSNPSRQVLGEILGTPATAKDRAVPWAKKHQAVMIENTRVGNFLDNFQGVGGATIKGKGLFNYFGANPEVADKDKPVQALRPWQYASKLFITAVWGYVSTTVCGASDRGTYLNVELPYSINPGHRGLPVDVTIRQLLKPHSKEIEAVNLVPFDRVCARRVGDDYKEAQKLICLGERRMALQEALSEIQPDNIKKALQITSKNNGVLASPVAAYEYFLESQERYEIDIRKMRKATGINPPGREKKPEERQIWKEKQLEKFGMKAYALIKTERDLMPPSKRPSIEIPKCLIGKVVL